MRFVILHDTSGFPIYLNADVIATLQFDEPFTRVMLVYGGTFEVTERPSEIIELLKGAFK